MLIKRESISGFKRSSVIVKRMRTKVIVVKISELGDSPVELLLRVVVVQINAVVLERIKVTFHRRIVVRAACAAHTLSNPEAFAVVGVFL